MAQDGAKESTLSVTHGQRFSKSHPCPICGGYDQAPRGKGERCFGFLSDDGQWAHCTRPEHAGSLQSNASSDTFAHQLQSPCSCGQQHGLTPMSRDGHKSDPREIVAVYDYETYQTVRFEPKGFARRIDRQQWNG